MPGSDQVARPTLRQRGGIALVWLAASVIAVQPAVGQHDPPKRIGRQDRTGRRHRTDGSAPVEAASQPAGEEAEAEKEAKPAKKAHYLSKSWGTRIQPSAPPIYARPMSLIGTEYGIAGLDDLTWLDFGMEHRTRFEYRSDDYRRMELDSDNQFLLRSRAYLGIRDEIDPLRFGVEFMDARQFQSEYPESNGDVDENDFLQLFGELYIKDALGPGAPVSLRVGRMTLEYVDRRIVGRQTWRNTITAFDGFRLQLGQPEGDWQFDFFAAMPVERRLRQPDRSEEECWFYGLIGAWRRWSQIVTLEPYWFILDEDFKDGAQPDREIHTMGLHAFGLIGESGFDYDVDLAGQFGDEGELEQRAGAVYGEVGYSFDADWKPRLSFSTFAATGDRKAGDGTVERFDRLYAPNHPWSMSDYFSWQNVIGPKVRLECQPFEPLRMDVSYGGYWLCSDTDAWVIPMRIDPTGQSGDFIGQEIELRARYQVSKQMELEAGYSHFMQGDFVDNTGPADDSDFFYVQATVRL